MNIDTFFKHHGIKDNPFAAEEARLDPVFDRLLEEHLRHPDFDKILGRIDRPSTSVVFGEKGSGKTAIRLLLSRDIAEHNAANPNARVLVVPYDDLNPIIDNLLQETGQDVDSLLKNYRLADHQDAMLSIAVTRLVDALLGEQPGGDAPPLLLPDSLRKTIRKMPKQRRIDLAVLAAIYDQPTHEAPIDRWHRIRRKLRVGWYMPLAFWGWLALFLLIAAGGLYGADKMGVLGENAWWTLPAAITAAILAVLGGGFWAWPHLVYWRLARHLDRATPALPRSSSELKAKLITLNRAELGRQPLPTTEDTDVPASDSRYQLTRQLIEAIGSLGYVGIIVLVDRVDEPTLITGDPAKMKAIIWPLFENKFLQQSNFGIKMLLPIELRHSLMRESSRFFQEARLDKQGLIDRLEWSGATLYDLCSCRINACRRGASDSISLKELFTEDVTRDLIIDALDQMQQPRDAFKFVYRVLQEHCRLVSEDEPQYQVPRLTLESVRRAQSQRLQDFQRGIAPG